MAHHSSKFEYDKATRTFLADISDLGPNPWCRPYSDAIDLGIDICSARTGKIATFVVDGEVRDPDGDIIYWVLKPTGQSSAQHLLPAEMSMRIYND